MQYVILNPRNDLYASRGKSRGEVVWVSERSGQYTKYTTQAKAEQAIRRSPALKNRALTVVPEPAHERALKLEELGHISRGNW